MKNAHDRHHATLTAYFRAIADGATPLQNEVDSALTAWDGLDGWLAAGGSLPGAWKRARPYKP